MPADAAIRILFLRGINVGGNNRLPMAGLRETLVGLGFDGVKTHIQSGNAVFRDASRADGAADRIAEAIETEFGFRPKAVVLDAAQLDRILAENPFSAEGMADGAKVQIGILARPAVNVDMDRLVARAATDERFHMSEGAFYLHAPAGIGSSKLATSAEKLLGVPMTMRNQRVAEAVAALANTLE